MLPSANNLSSNKFNIAFKFYELVGHRIGKTQKIHWHTAQSDGQAYYYHDGTYRIILTGPSYQPQERATMDFLVLPRDVLKDPTDPS
ncbi:hypothetical protein J6590_071436 [Homalodisca vitripennis]|nr:hypothetical protein J6590_071436 [Homalodisca vitripennis]